MSRGLTYALLLPLLGAEIWAQFVAHDQPLTTVFCILALGVVAVRHLLGRTDEVEAECAPNCPKCRESEGSDR